MLNFRNTNALFICLLIISIVGNLWTIVPFYAYLILVAAYSAILFYGCYFIGSNFFIHIICSVETDKKVIAISFDDGPDATKTPEILKILKENKVQAAFFCIGDRIAGNESLINQLNDEGHVIGNHSFSHHFWFDMFSSKKMLGDIRKMDEEVKQVVGKMPKLFRPPYGVTNPNLKKAIINGGYTPVGWSVRSMDTVIKDEKTLLDKMTSKIKPGAVFLFHDTSPATAAMLPSFIQRVRLHGYEIIRLDKMLNLQAYA